MSKIYIVDGTLREGEQSPGIYFTRDEKIEIAKALDQLGVPILDVGMPSVSEEERETIREISLQGLKASVGVSIRLKRGEVDQAIQCGVKEIFIICPVSSLHLRLKLGTDEEGVQNLAREVIGYASSKGLMVNFVAEDASRAEVPFILDLLCKAYRWGAQRAFLCDTVGVMEPFRMRDLVEKVRNGIPAEMGLGVHCHNDFGLATANTLASIEAGADYPSVTVNGIGERAGNPPLHEIVLSLEKILHRPHGIETRGLYSLSRLVEKYSGIFIHPHAPIVGLNAFRHESGIHVDGILKNHQTYKAIDPHEIGRESSFVLGKHTGGQTIIHLLKRRGYEAKEEELREILRRVKETKVAGGKERIRKMAEKVERYYQESLNFPMEVFWEMVEEVLRKDGSGNDGRDH